MSVFCCLQYKKLFNHLNFGTQCSQIFCFVCIEEAEGDDEEDDEGVQDGVDEEDEEGIHYNGALPASTLSFSVR